MSDRAPDRVLRLLRDDPRLAALAAVPFGFDVKGAGQRAEGVRLASGGGLRAVAGSGTGGAYYVCDDGAVLYADAEGRAGVVGATVDEAVEIVVGLPGGSGERERATEPPELDARRAELRTALGFGERPQAELIALRDAAARSTEPDHLLLNAEDGRAYRPLTPTSRIPLWEPVLARGRADLTRLRTDPGMWAQVAGDPVRRRLALRAAQFDRTASDLPFLRLLLSGETSAGMTDELRLAAVLVGLAGDADDVPLLHAVRDTTYDTRLGLSDLPESGADGAELRAWAGALDEALFGADPADEPYLTWIELARAQNLTELARVTLIRKLDEDPWGAAELASLRSEFEDLGDAAQALRAQRQAVAAAHPVPGSHGRISALLTLARLEREAGRTDDAADTLERLRKELDGSGDDLVRAWPSVMLGAHITREHHALAAAGLPDARARAVRAAAHALHARLTPAIAPYANPS